MFASYVCPCLPRLLRAWHSYSAASQQADSLEDDRLHDAKSGADAAAQQDETATEATAISASSTSDLSTIGYGSRVSANEDASRPPRADRGEVKTEYYGKRQSVIPTCRQSVYSSTESESHDCSLVKTRRSTYSNEQKPSEDSQGSLVVCPTAIEQKRKYSEQTKIGQIQLDLYQKRGSILKQPTMRKDSNLGKLHFRLVYDFKKSDFIVSVLEASLLSSGITACSDVHVSLQLQPEVDQKPRRTATAKGQMPIFNEAFKFPVTYDDLMERSLHFDIWSQARTNRKVLIGTVDFDLPNVDVSAELEILADIERQDEQFELGRLQVSLSYLVAAERLTVAVIEGRELKRMDLIGGGSDPYVKVNLIYHGKRLKKKQTSVKKNDRNPHWNEPLSFLVQQKLLKELAVQLIVMDRDSITPNEPIGEVILGAKAPTKEGRNQWNEIIDGKSGTPYWHRVKTCTNTIMSE